MAVITFYNKTGLVSTLTIMNKQLEPPICLFYQYVELLKESVFLTPVLQIQNANLIHSANQDSVERKFAPQTQNAMTVTFVILQLAYALNVMRPRLATMDILAI
jgi:hypothetical protein